MTPCQLAQARRFLQQITEGEHFSIFYSMRVGMLKDILLADDKRPQTLGDCVQLVESEVASKSGLTGIAVKGAFAVVKAVKPGFVREAVDHLLDEFVQQLEPFYAEWQKAGGDIVGFL